MTERSTRSVTGDTKGWIEPSHLRQDPAETIILRSRPQSPLSKHARTAKGLVVAVEMIEEDEIATGTEIATVIVTEMRANVKGLEIVNANAETETRKALQSVAESKSIPVHQR